MNINNLKILMRNLNRQKGFYFLNILGLAIGIACSTMIFLFVTYELEYDKYNQRHDKIYRIAVDAVAGNTMIYQTGTPAPLPPALYAEFPEIEKITRISDRSEIKTKYKDIVFNEDRIFLVDSTFLEIFTYSMIKGNPKTALSEPFSVVITESVAQKYFKSKDPINKVMSLDGEDYKVTGIIEDVPDQSHFHFDFLLPLTSFEGYYNQDNWWWNSFACYILLHSEADYNALEAKFPDFIKKYLFEGRDYDEIASKGNKWEYYLQPLTSIHLNSDIAGEFEANGNQKYIYILMVVAVFILAMACINFMNLSTAKSAKRAKEVGIRKVTGATKTKLINQFLSESVLISIISLVFGIIIVESLLPLFRDFTSRNMAIHYFENPWTIPMLIFFGLIIGILSGSYPSFVLSSFQPIKVLKGGLTKNRKGITLRNLLVVIQFSISVFLIIGTIIIFMQLQMIQNKNLGFNKEHIIVIKNAYSLGNKSDVFKNELRKNSNIIEVAGSHRMPGMRFNNIGFGAEGLDDGFTLNLLCSDPEYIDVMNFELTHGRFFLKEFKTDTAAIVINEAALKLIGWEDPVGKKLNNWGETRIHFNLIGVVKDFHYESMHEKVRPQAFMYLGGSYSWEESFISVRINPGSEKAVLDFLETSWNKFSAELPFTYSFFDKDYDALYNNEKQTKDLMVIFSVLAIFIACLGLLGLASFMATQRIKEIGIRKTLGASSRSIVWSFSKEYTTWVLIANILAWPVAWIVMNRWLNNFEYRVGLHWWIFIMATLIALLIAWLTVSTQSYRASRTNSVDALHYE
ncbi:MAG: ABC transporter permease [Bacteroidales bacterium]|nr:ABC transporter permease [Bacteroidales bacterium]